MGGVLQLRGRLRAGHPRGQDHRQGHDRPRRWSPRRWSWPALVGAIVWNLDHLVLRPARLVVATRSSAATRGRPSPRPASPRSSLSGWMKTLEFIVLAPSWALGLAFAADGARSPGSSAAGHPFTRATSSSAVCSSSPPALYSLGHGGNDAQKTMGIITGAARASGAPPGVRGAALGHPAQPRRHRLRHHVRRLAHRQDHGQRITKLAARSAASARRPRRGLTLVGATLARHPVSHHPHDHAAAIIGVGATPALSARSSGAWPAASSGPGCSPFPLSARDRLR